MQLESDNKEFRQAVIQTNTRVFEVESQLAMEVKLRDVVKEMESQYHELERITTTS